MFGGYNPSRNSGGDAAVPRNYVAGKGRGASGFQTRSDLGDGPSSANKNQNENGQWGAAPSGYVAGAGRGASKMGASSDAHGPQSQQPQQQSQSQSREQQQTQQQQSRIEGQYDDDDHEADKIWAAIDERLQNRRRKKKARNGPDHLEDPRARERQKIQHSFRDVKQELSSLTEDAWMNLPDAMGDHSLKHKRAQERLQQTFTPISDSLLESRVSSTQSEKNLNAEAAAASDMSRIGAARGTVLGLSLDKMSESAHDSGLATSVNPSGYLTSLGSTGTALPNNLGDIHKARLLLKSVRDTNPKHGQGWIASARIEEAAGKTLKARKIIQEGCETCPKFVDLWLEAARLHPLEVAKSILATGVRRVDNTVPLFLKAAELETLPNHKKAVLRKALEENPHSLELWKHAIGLEESEQGAKLLLKVAVEKVPTAIELWLALARLQTYAEAQKTLNQARKALPLEKSIWMAAAKLEESQMHYARIPKLVQKAFSTLASKDVVISRNQWIAEATDCETAGAPRTSEAIISRAIGLGVLEEDRYRTWSDDAKQCFAKGNVVTARAILAHALQQFPTKKALWMQAIELEQKQGGKEETDGTGADASKQQQHKLNQELDQVLQAASERLPNVEVFWLLRAKEQWLAGSVDTAREILTQAFEANPDSEKVWLAASKLEWETGEIERARVLLERARERAPSERVFMKSALLEREVGDTTAALALIEEGIRAYPKTATKLYMMGGQICSQDLMPKLEDTTNSNTNNETNVRKKKKSYLDKARKMYQEGIEKCSENVVLWILASRLEERAYTFVSETGTSDSVASKQCVAKARSLLELARLKHPKNDLLWLEATRLERRSGNTKLAESLMARALQECPKSGRLLAENITTAPRVEQKSKSTDAIKRNPESPLVIAAVAALFASDRKIVKARKWFERAVLLDPDLGDSWAKFYNFESKHGTPQQKAAVKDRCVKAEPKHGEVWQAVTKTTANRRKSVAEGLELVANELVATKSV